ncbi:MAG: S24 family peptidase [Novosphingobium sp.]|nr:S24 family peptidase [Novosphingobium sp.]
MLELAYGMGGTFLDGVDPGESLERFPRAFVRIFTSAPASQLCWSHGIGDSMYPTIGDRDVLLIDRSRDTIRVNDQVWVLSVSGIGMVKRVRVEANGKVVLLSDNEHVPEYPVGEDELTVIGRVIAVVKNI